MVNKGILVVGVIIVISIIIYGAMTAQHGKTLANVDQKLKEVDAATANMINICNAQTDAQQQGICDSQLLGVYNNECITYHDKLSVCATNGPLEKYLRMAGYI